MIPLKDDQPRVTTPYVTFFLIALNTLVFFFEISLTPPTRNAFIFQFGLIPKNLGSVIAGHPVAPPELSLLSIFTSMFIHASWLHIIFNMWFLWIFGDNIEDHLGHFRYLLLYLACGIAAALAQTAFSGNSAIPTVGASGAIAGIMGAYFLLYPSARVLTLIPFIFIYLTWLPAWLILGYWFIVQFLSGAATSIAYSQSTGGGIAFWAHVGGFLSGLALIKVFPAQPKRYRYSDWVAR